jgi:NADPH:quinone reductase-like Zn-dependent oxidoreductase
MRALVCREWGDPTKSRAEGGVLGVEDVPPPGRVPPRGIRVRIICASLNFADCLLVRNLYQEKPALPFTPGGEFCGAVLELGAELHKDGPFRVGQVVAGAVVGGGAMAEELVVPDASASAFVVPAGISPAAASSFPIAYGTAYMALAQRARVGPGTRVLVLGAGGGVGLAAVQIAKALGAVVVAVARGAAKVEACRAAGADACLDSDALHASSDTKHTKPRSGLETNETNGNSTPAPRQLSTQKKKKKKETFESLPSATRAAFGEKNLADVLFDPVGGAAFHRGLSSIRWGGQALVIGFASGAIPALPLNVALVKNITVHGVYWGAHAAKDPGAMARCAREVGGLLARGSLVPKVDVSATAPLARAHRAFAALEQRRVVGKAVVVVSGEEEAMRAVRGERSVSRL